MIRETFPDESRVIISQFSGLLVDYARSREDQDRDSRASSGERL